MNNNKILYLHTNISNEEQEVKRCCMVIRAYWATKSKKRLNQKSVSNAKECLLKQGEQNVHFAVAC